MLNFSTYSIDNYLINSENWLNNLLPSETDKASFTDLDDMKRLRVTGAAVRTVVEEGDYLHSREMSADQLSYAGMGTDLHANISITSI